MHEHGGSWTDDKLEVMRRYFSAYSQALKYKKFELIYIDAFAGSGERIDSNSNSLDQSMPLFEIENKEIIGAKEGSARIALKINPPFSRYIFVDTSEEHVAALNALKAEFPDQKIEILSEDANQALRKVVKKINWRKSRAAIFIDPYGMQIDWETLKILSATESVDIALLFPTGPLNRMLPRDGNIPKEWEKRIDTHLGPCDWRKAAYSPVMKQDLFSESTEEYKKTINTEGLRNFIYESLTHKGM